MTDNKCSPNRDRSAKNPGGMQCECCDEIFIGEEWHALCGICVQKTADEIAAAQRPSPGSAEANWKDDPAADERWNAGCDFALIQLCATLDVDPHSVSWDAATETIDGDVRAVIRNILRANRGENWSPNAPARQEHAMQELADQAQQLNMGYGPPARASSEYRCVEGRENLLLIAHEIREARRSYLDGIGQVGNQCRKEKLSNVLHDDAMTIADALEAYAVSSAHYSPEQDSASAGLQSQSGINRSLSEGTPREGAPIFSTDRPSLNQKNRCEECNLLAPCDDPKCPNAGGTK